MLAKYQKERYGCQGKKSQKSLSGKKMDEITSKFTGKKGVILKKIEWLKRFPESGYHIGNTCKKVNVTVDQLSQWRLRDKAFYVEYKKIYEKGVLEGILTPKAQIRKPELKEKWLELYGKQKLSPKETCKKIGIPEQILNEWKRDDPKFEKKHKELVCKKQTGITNRNIDKTKERFKGVREALSTLREKRQGVWLDAFKKSGFNITTACDRAGIKRASFYRWKKLNPEFMEAYLSATEEKKDIVEDKLMKNIKEGDSACIIFACKTLLKNRGYIEKQEIEHSGNFGVMVVPGKVEDAHDWAIKAKKQQQLLKEKSMETDYIHDLQE